MLANYVWQLKIEGKKQGRDFCLECENCKARPYYISGSHGRPREPERKKQDLPKVQILSKIKLDIPLTNRHVPNDLVRERKRKAITSCSSISKESIL